ncbi:hypothetical protein LXA43DRAFT_370322 [Ganoderma leucocontextum]|nr:hypothetical protein LXA43DRAFT_370322 [Ganoderma leucocontextum]
MDLAHPALDIQGRVHRRTRYAVTHHHHGISDHPSLTCIPRRPPSARLRGISAPYVRTSLSPDRVLRRRERCRPHLASIQADIEISSDSEVEHPPTRRSSSRHPAPSVSHILEVIDLTRLPSTPPPEICPSPSGSSASLDPDDEFLGTNRDNQQDTTPICTYPVPSGRRRPTWLRAAMGQLYSGHKGVQCEVRCDSKDTSSRFKTSTGWFIKCQECDIKKTMIIPAGPGLTVANFVQHVDSVHPHFRSASPRRESG